MKFLILRGGKEKKNVTIRKIWIFKQNLALNCSMVKKFDMRKLNLNTQKIKKKKINFQQYQIFDFKGKIIKFQKIWILECKFAPITPVQGNFMYEGET